jgi:hypothetical protein
MPRYYSYVPVADGRAFTGEEIARSLCLLERVFADGLEVLALALWRERVAKFDQVRARVRKFAEHPGEIHGEPV